MCIRDRVDVVLVQRHRAVQHQLALVAVEDAVALQVQQEAARLDVQLVELRAVEDAGRATDCLLYTSRCV